MTDLMECKGIEWDMYVYVYIYIYIYIYIYMYLYIYIYIIIYMYHNMMITNNMLFYLYVAVSENGMCV